MSRLVNNTPLVSSARNVCPYLQVVNPAPSDDEATNPTVLLYVTRGRAVARATAYGRYKMLSYSFATG
jgi:muramidase (phage lysozyme)